MSLKNLLGSLVMTVIEALPLRAWAFIFGLLFLLTGFAQATWLYKVGFWAAGLFLIAAAFGLITKLLDFYDAPSKPQDAPRDAPQND